MFPSIILITVNKLTIRHSQAGLAWQVSQHSLWCILPGFDIFRRKIVWNYSNLMNMFHAILQNNFILESAKTKCNIRQFIGVVFKFNLKWCTYKKITFFLKTFNVYNIFLINVGKPQKTFFLSGPANKALLRRPSSLWAGPLKDFFYSLPYYEPRLVERKLYDYQGVIFILLQGTLTLSRPHNCSTILHLKDKV